ncbi:MAG: sigma 54-interacting transcriptional regulator [candidate division WOR-3 bacterium]|nr:sigma 54-interacting transcriptional regulator [candidate division WOR-3 bacterium]
MSESSERKRWINESKRRCKKMGLNPDKPCITNTLSRSELLHRQKINESLIKSALPYMKLCSETFKLCGSILVLTDRDGYILKAIGPRHILQSRSKIGLGEGGSLREEDAGTNAVALALRYHKPVYVEGEEYYLKIFQSGACFCSPILDNGELLGTIVIVHPEKRGHPYTFALVKILSGIIQKEYRKTFEFNFYTDLAKLLNLIFVITDNQGKILWLSEKAKKLLHFNTGKNITEKFDEEIVRKKPIINEIFESENLHMKFFVLKKEYEDKYIFIFEPVYSPVNKERSLSLRAPYTFDDIIGLETIKETAKKIAIQDTNLLIIGESGTGKDLLAAAIHNESSRAGERFVVVNCAAIPENLFESELFGYKRGAFTDARYDKTGKIEFANNGTLFFDEIAELPLNVQAKLLRVIEDKKVIPLGCNEGRVVNVRFIFATNRNLEELVAQGKFREDLYYRIHSPKIEIPPLRERRDEIPLLIEHLLLKIKERYRGYFAGITESAKKRLLEFDFPGNVRQLEKILEQAFLRCKNGYIELKDLGLENHQPVSIEEKVRRYRAKLIFECYQRNGCDVIKTCNELKISRAQLYRYLKIINSKGTHD